MTTGEINEYITWLLMLPGVKSVLSSGNYTHRGITLAGTFGSEYSYESLQIRIEYKWAFIYARDISLQDAKEISFGLHCGILEVYHE